MESSAAEAQEDGRPIAISLMQAALRGTAKLIRPASLRPSLGLVHVVIDHLAR